MQIKSRAFSASVYITLCDPFPLHLQLLFETDNPALSFTKYTVESTRRDVTGNIARVLHLGDARETERWENVLTGIILKCFIVWPINIIKIVLN